MKEVESCEVGRGFDVPHEFSKCIGNPCLDKVQGANKEGQQLIPTWRGKPGRGGASMGGGGSWKLGWGSCVG